jgi:hypothetical protein
MILIGSNDYKYLIESFKYYESVFIMDLINQFYFSSMLEMTDESTLHIICSISLYIISCNSFYNKYIEILASDKYSFWYKNF